MCIRDRTNPDAPKGGTLRLMASGSFDTLNPYTLKGTSPIGTGDFLQYGVNELNEPLMVGTGLYDPSGDEPASSYGLIAKSVEYAENRSWVVFNLRPEARFHDGRPITASDVAFSYRTLVKQGHPMYRTYLQEVKRVAVSYTHLCPGPWLFLTTNRQATVTPCPHRKKEGARAWPA